MKRLLILKLHKPTNTSASGFERKLHISRTNIAPVVQTLNQSGTCAHKIQQVYYLIIFKSLRHDHFSRAHEFAPDFEDSLFIPTT